MLEQIRAALDPYFNVITGWASIVGFILSAVVWFQTTGIKSQVRAYSSFKRFQLDKSSIREQLESIIKSLVNDDIKDRQLKSDLFRLLGQLGGYPHVLDRADKKKMDSLRAMLTKSQWSKAELNEITMLISHLAGKLDSKEEYLGE